MPRSLLLIAIVLCIAHPAFAEGSDRPPAAPARAVVAEIIDGDTFALEAPIDGARVVKLAGIQAPKPLGGRPAPQSGPLADRARDTLAGLVLDETVELRIGGPAADRHGRLLAHVYRDDGTWIQGEMLERGLARVLSFADNLTRAAEMLDLEDAARQAGRGLWSDPSYAILTPEDAGRHVGSFQIVEGRVMKAARVKSYVYLNFGADWRTDFTVSVPVKLLDRFADAELDLLSLGGRDIRVRGWLKSYNGPLIDATHPEQIEVLEARPAP
jgi:endonuclease YncB( thermonuclease family)